jgi:hypothetical protein
MSFLVVAVAASALLVLPAATQRFGRRLAPGEWTWLAALALAAGAGLLELALVLRSVPAVLNAAGVDAVADACTRAFRPLLSGGPLVSWAAAAAAVLLAVTGTVAAVRGRRLRRRLAADLWLGDHVCIAGHDVVVLPVDRPLAASFEGPEPVIVASRGLIDRLPTEEVDVVVLHEAAHLAHRHQRLLTLTDVVAPILGRMPVIWRSLAAVRLAVERWADEEASAGSPERRAALRRSLLRLLDNADAADLPPGFAASAAFAEARTVVARVDALAASPTPVASAAHAALYLPGTGAAVAIAAGLYQWGDQLRTVVVLTGRCSL